MNLLAEWLAFSLLFVAIGTGIILFVKRPMWKAAQKASLLSYTRDLEWLGAYCKMRDALGSLIAELELNPAEHQAFPEAIRDELFAAYQTGRDITTTGRH
jgi:hypothetical protein